MTDNLSSRKRSRVEQLAAWTLHNGGSLPKYKYKAADPEEASLAAWMTKVGIKHGSGTLAPELREELMKIPAMAIRLQEWDNNLPAGESSRTSL